MRRMSVSSEENFEGKLFIQFVALQMVSYIKKKMDENGLFSNYTIQSLLDELDTIEFYQQPGKTQMTGLQASSYVMITEKASAYVYRMVNSCVNSSIIYIFKKKPCRTHPSSAWLFFNISRSFFVAKHQFSKKFQQFSALTSKYACGWAHAGQTSGALIPTTI